MMSYFQDGGHDVRPPLAAAYAAVSAGCSVVRWARVTSFACSICYSSWSIVHSYIFILTDVWQWLWPAVTWHDQISCHSLIVYIPVNSLLSQSRRAGKWLRLNWPRILGFLWKNPKIFKSSNLRFFWDFLYFCAILYRSYLISYSNHDLWVFL